MIPAEDVVANLTQIHPFLERRNQRAPQGLNGVVYLPHGLVQVLPTTKVTPAEDAVYQVSPERAIVDSNRDVCRMKENIRYIRGH